MVTSSISQRRMGTMLASVVGAMALAACSVTFDPGKLSPDSSKASPTSSSATKVASAPKPSTVSKPVRRQTQAAYSPPQAAYQPPRGQVPAPHYAAPRYAAPQYVQAPQYAQAEPYQPAYVNEPIQPPQPQFDYVVAQPGDTLSGIARQAGSTPEVLMYHNRMRTMEIQAGQRIYIPQ